MSRFTNLRRHLGLAEAIRIYLRLKVGNRNNIGVSKLAHPFSMRKNPYDYGTFEEVIVKEAYKMSWNFIPNRIIDGGGNIGLTAAYFATQFPQASIVSLEPDEENFQLLSKNVSLYQNIKALQGGVWNKSASLVVKDVGLGNNGFMVEEVTPDTRGAIKAWSIGDLMKEMQWDHCDVVKLDVEGSEKEIFSENYESWLPKTKVLIVELHDRMKKGCSKAVFGTMSQYDFSFEVAGENLIFRNEN